MSGRQLRRGQVEEEDASKLKLGTEFEDSGCLTISEVKHLLDGRGVADTPVFKKTSDYVNSFTVFSSKESAISVREALKKDENMSQFEQAQVGNLVPGDVDEAKSLIPSLMEHDEGTLQVILDELDALRKMQ